MDYPWPILEYLNLFLFSYTLIVENVFDFISMIYIKYLFFILFIPYVLALPNLVTDDIDNKFYPKNFRTTQNIIMDSSINIEGLSNLYIMGSGAFNLRQLKYILSKVDKPIVIVDLRRESHFYLNGIPISSYQYGNWDNRTLSRNLISKKESFLMSRLIGLEAVKVSKLSGTGINKYFLDTSYMTIRQLVTEEMLLKNLGIEYKRFYISDHMHPDPVEVDYFINFVNSLSEHKWLYFHCRAGKGRTTLFMTMYDILKNSNKLTLNEILKRQHALGGLDLSNLDEKNMYKYVHISNRYRFLLLFYHYVKYYSNTKWSEWIHNRDLNLYET